MAKGANSKRRYKRSATLKNLDDCGEEGSEGSKKMARSEDSPSLGVPMNSHVQKSKGRERR